MLLSQSYRLPFVDPGGYEIVAPQGLQLLAERADSVLTGFDKRTSAVLTKPTLRMKLTSATSAWGSGSDNVVVWDGTPDDDTSGGGIVNGTWQFWIDPAKLNPDCYMLAGWNGNSSTVTANNNTIRDFKVRVWDTSGAASALVNSFYTRQYETGTSGEDGGISMVLRLRPRQLIDFAFSHGNTSAGVSMGTNSRAWMVYLGPAT